MRKAAMIVLGLTLCLTLAACTGQNTGEAGADYGRIISDFSGMTRETAGAYLDVVDEFSAHLGYDRTEAAAGEYLHGGFVSDWDGDGTPELCLLLETSPRDSGTWDGTPVYGWAPPTLYLYTFRNGQAVRAGECDLYFATGGREAVIALLTTGNGPQMVRWDRSEFAEDAFVFCYELVNGELQKRDTPQDVADASREAETAEAFLDALGEKALPLLYNSSGDARIEGDTNARELRSALAAKAS